MPAASKEQLDTFNEWQRKTTSAECAARYLTTSGQIDVVGLLPHVRAPTLVMHARSDAQVPFECGRQLAAEIPDAKFIALQSNNHVLWSRTPQHSGSSRKLACSCNHELRCPAAACSVE